MIKPRSPLFIIIHLLPGIDLIIEDILHPKRSRAIDFYLCVFLAEKAYLELASGPTA
jgi:hypothetical protein